MDMNVLCVQSRYISEVDIKRRRGVVGIHDKNVSTPDGLARIELRWFRSGGCGRYIWYGGFANSAVLMECYKLRVCDDLDLLGIKPRELQTSQIPVFSEVEISERRESHLSTQ